MEYANITLSIGGDHGNTVPKQNVSAAEIAVLRAIHGEDSVKDVAPAGERNVSNRAELTRLLERYEKEPGKGPVSQLYPGAGARLLTRLSDLGIPDEFYKAEKRAAPPTPPSEDEEPEDEPEEAPVVEDDEDADGVGEMNDRSLFQ